MNYNIVAATNEDTVVATYEPSKVRSDSYQSEAELEKEFIRLLCEQGYTYLPLHTEDKQIANLRSQLEELNHYQFSDTEWRQFFSDVIALSLIHISVPCLGEPDRGAVHHQGMGNGRGTPEKRRHSPDQEIL